MPYKPKRPCSYPSRPRLTDGRYCEEHQKIITAHYHRHERTPESKRRYGRTWRRNVTVEEMRAYISARIAKGWNSPDPVRGRMAAVCGGEN